MGTSHCICGADGSSQMEFPLFPVFLCAAVQTPPVPQDWTGLGKSLCLPITHLATLESLSRAMGHSVWIVLKLHITVCLFSTSSLFFIFFRYFQIFLKTTSALVKYDPV